MSAAQLRFQCPLKYFKQRYELKSSSVHHSITTGVGRNAFVEKNKATLPTFAGENIEAFCEVLAAFNTQMLDWKLANDADAHFVCFTQVLRKQARSNWDKKSRPIRDSTPQPTMDTFRSCLDAFTLVYCDRNDRDKIQDWLSNGCLKPMDVDIRQHAERLDTLMTYHDMLPGHSISFNEETPSSRQLRKKVLFQSFVPAWQAKFQQMHGHYSNDSITWDKIVEAMSATKTVTDIKRQHSRTVQQFKSGRGRGFGGRGFGGRGFGGRGFSRGTRDSSRHRPYPKPFTKSSFNSRPGGFDGPRPRNHDHRHHDNRNSRQHNNRSNFNATANRQTNRQFTESHYIQQPAGAGLEAQGYSDLRPQNVVPSRDPISDRGYSDMRPNEGVRYEASGYSDLWPQHSRAHDNFYNENSNENEHENEYSDPEQSYEENPDNNSYPKDNSGGRHSDEPFMLDYYYDSSE